MKVQRSLSLTLVVIGTMLLSGCGASSTSKSVDVLASQFSVIGSAVTDKNVALTISGAPARIATKLRFDLVSDALNRHYAFQTPYIGEATAPRYSPVWLIVGAKGLCTVLSQQGGKGFLGHCATDGQVLAGGGLIERALVLGKRFLVWGLVPNWVNRAVVRLGSGGLQTVPVVRNLLEHQFKEQPLSVVLIGDRERQTKRQTTFFERVSVAS